ncbi:GNAT family N-acetyltransferase [Gardnerella swidsinskii]|uniref:N-acetyltransferase n=1 Tax=Gardnerella swidsinskii TaxID=2792979 RepID=A0ABM6GIH1_9BIFI|nr:GNAT family N-acetyltransferase [Gardnerella swidsinskii]ADB13914.1 acetyltransferase, GNAT family [Gardnerella vaginalis 409-05]APW18588.1 N-acetyltransferase [Gardnerella vaginalis]EFH71195.1 acetyltransferase [Gardnerella vaginalis 5-1]RFT35079.1 N-acetyltransferase [Bifidobacteriaceae bacterium NR020]CQB86406.1 putative acyltransferase [Chlamydia trachomatis]
MNLTDVQIKEYKKYNSEDIPKLYDSVGWSAYTDDLAALENGFNNSLKILAAYKNDELVGIIRAVGDGYTVVFIQDILVLPEYQRQGIGSALLKAIVDCYPNVRQIQLTTDCTEKTIAFYKSVGFIEFSEIDCCGFIKDRT